MPKDDFDGLIDDFDTVPPPAGPDDLHGAPTRVGPVPDEVYKELMKAAGRRASELSARANAAAGTTPPAPPTTPAPAVLPAAALIASAPVLPAEALIASAPVLPAAALVASASAPTVPVPAARPAAPRPNAPLATPPAHPSSAAATPFFPSPVPTPGRQGLPAGDHPHAHGHATEPGRASVEVPVQSGRTVPLSAAMVAEVMRSVDERRAAAGPVGSRATAGAAPSPAAAFTPPAIRRPRYALGIVLALGLALFAAGLVMFFRLR